MSRLQVLNHRINTTWLPICCQFSSLAAETLRQNLSFIQVPTHSILNPTTKMHTSHILLFLTGITAALTTQPIPREEPTSAPPDDSIHIAGVAFAGSGCPAGTLSGGFLPDSKLTLNYTTFIAKTGKGYPVDQSRKNCQSNFKIQYPSGWQFSVAKTTYRGYASLPAGVTGIARSTYYFSGSSAYPVCLLLSHEKEDG